MKRLFLNFLSLAILTLLSVDAKAQINMPAPSPGAKLVQTVGLTDVTIEYSRPGVKDRVIFAKDGLVPYGDMWRTGANAATKFTFSDDVKVGGNEVTAGSYAVLTIPGSSTWQVNLYKYESGSWGSYRDKDPVAKVEAKTQKTADKTETFTIDVNNIRNNSATIDLVWENTKVSIPLEVEVDKKVMADIERVMSGPSQNDYFAAATYYHESGKDLNKALKYINKATEEDPKFWQVRRKALILADLNKKAEAIKAAKHSMELAEKAGNEDYIRMNKKSIEEWSKS